MQYLIKFVLRTILPLGVRELGFVQVIVNIIAGYI